MKRKIQSGLNECLLTYLFICTGDKPQIDTQGSMFLKRDAVPDKYSWSAKVVDVGDQDNTISFEVSVQCPISNKVHGGLAKRHCLFVF